MAEDPIYSGLFSGLVAKSKLDQLLDELYGDLERATRGEAVAWIARTKPHYYPLPDGFEEFEKWFARLEAEFKEEDTRDIAPKPEQIPEPAIVS